jgi:DNA-binding CsgD family transcriptional regulator
VQGVPEHRLRAVVVAEAEPALGLVVTAYPLPPRKDVINEARCLLVVRDPNGTAEAIGGRLLQAYKLTKAETRLAETLISGASLQEAADLLQVTVNTCKTQLQSIYRKTDCRNRAELARAIFALS